METLKHRAFDFAQIWTSEDVRGDCAGTQNAQATTRLRTQRQAIPVRPRPSPQITERLETDFRRPAFAGNELHFELHAQSLPQPAEAV
jgi:hypothetical protein